MRGLENKRRRTPAWEDDTSVGEGLEISPGMWAEVCKALFPMEQAGGLSPTGCHLRESAPEFAKGTSKACLV